MLFETRRKLIEWPFFIIICFLFVLFWVRTNELENAGLFNDCHGYPSNLRSKKFEEVVEETDCNFETRLGNNGEFGVFPLISFPGSGNTLVFF